MNPRYNPLTLMVLGSLLLVLTYFTSALWQLTPFQWVVAYTVMAVAILTLASGVVLAYIQTFREKDPARFRR